MHLVVSLLVRTVLAAQQPGQPAQQPADIIANFGSRAAPWTERKVVP